LCRRNWTKTWLYDELEAVFIRCFAKSVTKIFAKWLTWLEAVYRRFLATMRERNDGVHLISSLSQLICNKSVNAIIW
jgi:hypothetical protein